ASASRSTPSTSNTAQLAQKPTEPLSSAPAPANQPQKEPEQVSEKAKQAPAAPAEPVNSKPAPKKPSAVKGKSSANWSYSGKTGPAYWADLSPDYATCATGLNQSPINITNTIHAALKPIRTLQKFPAKELINTGQTLQVNFKTGNMMVLDKTPFQLSQVHFHSPSENRIDGKVYPLEAHFVHSDNEGNLAIIAVLFKEGEANPALNQLWAQLPDEIGKPVLLKTRITPNNLMPTKQQYYRYSGSLETPPCTEGVRWILMKTPVEASKDQLKMFETAMQLPNNRPIQALNGRMVVE
ncbi:MAG TPA: carbonic anhydrase family protein, partial [Methylophilus sp.]